MKIAHLTSVHPRFDTRIFFKMCKSSNKLGKVYLVCADGKGDKLIDNINIIDVGKVYNRTLRFWISVNKIYKQALKLNADIYHLHDPELIRIGLKLIKNGKKVIFDSHEHVSDSIMTKNYIPKFLRVFISKIYNYYEQYSLKKINNLIGATHYIVDSLKKININSIGIYNYPLLDISITEYKKISHQNNRINYICYVGIISKLRGIEELIKALELTKNQVILNLAGHIYPDSYERDLEKLPGWKHVNYLGFVKKDFLMSKFDNKLGIIPFLRAPNHIKAEPNKMFEYMLYKLPIACSNFNVWKKYIENNNYGKVFNPADPDSIARVIDYIIDNPKESIKMGLNGHQAVIDKFNWNNEEKKLFSLYKNITKSK